MNLGFSLSYYSIDKLNALYKGYPDKKAYRCYAFMTKNDFLNTNNREMNVDKSNIIISKNPLGLIVCNRTVASHSTPILNKYIVPGR